MTNNIITIHSLTGYTIANAHEDIGNVSADLRPYLKIEEYERDKENLVSEEELSTALNNYPTNTALSNALDDYASKTLLNESLSNRPTYDTTDAISENVDTLTDQLIETQSAKANVEHGHEISDINELTTALEGKASSIHTHDISEINDLSTLLASKADTDHSHGMANVVGLYAAIAGKADTQHTHEISDITDLSTSLGNHTHNFSDIKTFKGKVYKQLTNDNVLNFTTEHTVYGDGTAYYYEYDIAYITYKKNVMNNVGSIITLQFTIDDNYPPEPTYETKTYEFKINGNIYTDLEGD